MMICYDICFHMPAIAQAETLGVRDFVFATHWENGAGPPMSLAVPFFQGCDASKSLHACSGFIAPTEFDRWSRGVDANLLAANQGMGLVHTGSGIFSRGSALATAWQPADARDEALLVSRVPFLRTGDRWKKGRTDSESCSERIPSHAEPHGSDR